jgi:hypothetical protein
MYGGHGGHALSGVQKSKHGFLSGLLRRISLKVQKHLLIIGANSKPLLKPQLFAFTVYFL